MANEIELKLALPANAIRRVLRHPVLQAAKPAGPQQTLLNTYYDTPDLALSAQRVALRTRKAGRRWLQTVKCAATSLGGLSSRPEWEQAFCGEFDFGAIDNPAVRQLLEQQRDRIVPLFTTNFRRRTLIHTPRPGVEIHLMLDQGEIIAGERREEICELELELAQGKPDDLLALACELAQELPLRPYDESKAARGYRLFHGTPLRPQAGSPSPVQASMTPCVALQQLGLQLIADWSSNLNIWQRRPDEPECLHQQRVTLRRLRAALRVFAPVWDQADTWRHSLGTLAASLAPAREAEVLTGMIAAHTAAAPVSITLEELSDAAREAANQALAQAYSSDYREKAAVAMLNLTRALLALDTTAGAGRIEKFALRALREAHKHARRRLQRADPDQAQTLHALRLSLKQLRDSTGFFQTLLPTRNMAKEMRQLGKLIERLGHLNDQASAWPQLARLGEQQAALGTAAGFVAGCLAVTSSQSRRRTLRDIAAWLNTPKPWDRH